MTGGRPSIRVVLADLAGGAPGVGPARTLRDAGLEVVYAGRLTTAAQLARTVEQEDPDALGVVFDSATDPALLAEAMAHDGVHAFGIAAHPSEEPSSAVPDAGRADETVPLETPLETVPLRCFATAEEAGDWLVGRRDRGPDGKAGRGR